MVCDDLSVKSLCWWFLFHDIISFDKYGEFQILCISVQLLLAGTGVQDYHILHVYGGENRWDDDPIVISCLWCSNVSFSSTHLYEYVKTVVGGADDVKQWVADATYDLCHCSDCVDEYHHALKKAFVEDKRFTDDLKKTVYTNNLARLEKSLKGILSKCHDSGENSEDLSEEDMFTFWSTQRSTAIQREFECPLLELLKYPRLLMNHRLNELFVLALTEMEGIGKQLEVLQKYPGVYLLLVHQNQKVRHWAINVVQGLGQVDWEDFDNLQEVMTWMITIITFDQFIEPVECAEQAAWDASQTLLLPKHFFVHDSPKEFWIGVCMFISVLSGPCIQSRFIRSCNDFILTILSALDCHTSNSVAFWPALQCLSTLLDRLGSRFWQFVPPTSNFDYVLMCILKSHHFQTELKKWNEETYQPCAPQDDPNNEDIATNCQGGFGYMERKLNAVKSEFHSDPSFMTDPVCMKRLPFNWIVPFLHSLLDFGEAAFNAIKTLFSAVHSFPCEPSEHSPLFNESLFTLSQMVELLFSKKAFSIMYSFRGQWLPAVHIALHCFERAASCLTSMMHMFMVLLGILGTDEAKQLDLTEKVVSYLKKLMASLKPGLPIRSLDVKRVAVKDIIGHVTEVLQILATTYTNPTLTLNEHTVLDVEVQLQPHETDMGELVDDLSEIKSESTYKDSPSDSSTSKGSVSGIRLSSSKQMSQFSRKVPIKKMSRVRVKSHIAAKILSSDESTDELEDFEPVTHSSCTKRKRSALIQGSLSIPKKKLKLTRRQVHFLSDDTTDDIEGENEPDVRTNNKASDNVLGSLSAHCSKPTSKPDPAVVPCQTKDVVSMTCERESHGILLLSHNMHMYSTVKGKSPLKLKKPRVCRFTKMESTTKAHISVPHDVSTSSGEKEDNTTHQKASLSETDVQVMSIDELNEFENFSDTAVMSQDVSVVKQKDKLRKQLLLTTDVESSNELLEIHHKRKVDDSVDKIQVWLESSSESCSLVAKPDSQPKEVSIPCALASQPVPVQPSLGNVVCNTSNDHSHVEVWPETVTSTQQQGEIEREANGTEEISVEDRYSTDSTSSADSLLPAVVWEQEPKRDNVLLQTMTNPTPAEIKEPPVSSHHVQSLVVSTTEIPQQSQPVEEYLKLSLGDVSDTSTECEFQQTKSEVAVPVSTVALSSPVSKSLKLKELSLKVNRIETVSSIHKPAFRSPKLKVTNIDVAEGMEVTPTTSEVDATCGVSHPEGKASCELTIAKEPLNSINSSRTSSRLDLVHLKKSIPKPPDLTGSGSKKQPVSRSPCLLNSLKHRAKQMKSTGRVLLTEVPGIKYTSRKAILKTTIDAQLPSQSSHPLKSVPSRIQSSGVLLKCKQPSAGSALSSKSCVDEQFSSASSLLEASSSSVQPSHSHSMKSSRYVKGGSISQSSQETDVMKSLITQTSSSVRLPCRIQLNEIPGNSKDPHSPSPTTSKTSKECKLMASSASISKRYQKPHLCGTAPGYRSTSLLSVETQRLLDRVGQSSRLATDEAVSVSRPKHTCSTNMPQLHVTLKPRVLPKADDLLTKVLSWEAGAFLIPQQMENGKLIEPILHLSEELIKVPQIFESYDQYFDTFKPLIFLELSSMIFSDIHNPDTQKPNPIYGKVVSVTRAGPTLQIMKWRAFISIKVAKDVAHAVEDDLVSVDFSQVDERILSSAFHLSGQELQFCFAVVVSVRKDFNSHSRREQPRCELILDLKVSGLEFAANELLDGCEVELKVVTSLKTVRRQWNGLINLHTSVLVRDILYPRGGAYFCCKTAHCGQIQRFSKILMDYNPSQLEVIHQTVNAVSLPFAHPRICLIQGPPGTGKTHTISGIVSAVLTELSSQANSTHNVSALPGQLFSAAQKSSKPRILICAPSNAAIDEVIRRLAKDEVIDTHNSVESRDLHSQGINSKEGKFHLVRIGQPEKIHPELVKLGLDEQAEKLLAVESDVRSTSFNLNNIRSELQHIDAEINKMEKDLYIRQHSSQRTEAQTEFEAEIRNLKDRLANYKNRRQEVSDQYKDAKIRSDSRIRGAANARKSILLKTDIICSTLSGCATAALRDCRNKFQFSCIIVDEAAQCTELDVLIPLHFMCSKLVLVGDPLQLPAVVKSQPASALGYGQSLFERLYRYFSNNPHQENPVHLLKIQYRMFPEICLFPSRHFYNGCLKTDKAVEKESELSKFHPFLMFDVANGSEVPYGMSLMNKEECNLILELVKSLLRSGISPRNIGIITPYKAQERRIKEKLKELSKKYKYSYPFVDVGTVDGFQGREKEFIIISCVRAQSQSGSIGFLSERRRMNVAITRCKKALYIVCHIKTLRINEDWKALIHHAETCRAIICARETYGEVVKRILKSKYLKSRHESDACVSSASPVSSGPKPIDNYVRQQPYSISKCDEHRKSASERKRASHNIAPAESDRRISHHRSVPSKPFQGGMTHISYGHQSQMQHKSDSGKPIERECMPSSHGHNTHFSAAQIVLQDLPRAVKERPVSPGICVQSHIVSPSELESVPREPSLHIINRIPDCAEEVEHQSIISLHHKKGSSDSMYRPTSWRLSTAAVSDQCEVSPSKLLVPTAADHPDGQRNEMKISGRGLKRVAHRSDREIKTQRQVIEHKLTPVNPTSLQLPPKNPRRGTTTASTRDVRMELMKRMSKK